tara:strand:+ start:731 stop:910 length:180 start_codon:yes stop_codon:yes gene_type:complete
MIKTVKKIHNPKTNADDENYLTMIYQDNTEWCVPKSESNRHYQEILQWVADGNTIEEAD